jgi:hypothetical protein
MIEVEWVEQKANTKTDSISFEKKQTRRKPLHRPTRLKMFKKPFLILIVLLGQLKNPYIP